VTTQDDISGAFARFAVGRGARLERGWSLRGYFDWAERDTTRIGYERGIVDLDYRGWSSWGERQDLVWGLQFDHTSDEIRPGSNFLFDPGSRDWIQLNGFFQNTSELVPGRLFAMVGSKVTYHEFAGVEAQPSVRLWWSPSDRQALWAALSRPVRMPSRLEENGMIVVAYADPGLLSGGAPTGVLPFGIRGDEDLGVEELLAYELGHRWRSDRWALSTALFYNDYRSLIALPRGAIGSFSDAASGESYGVELSATVRPTARWRLELAWNWLETEIDGPVAQFEDGGAPEQMAQLRSYFDLTPSIELDGALYFVDHLPARQVDSYLRLDVGVTWRPGPEWRLVLRGQNLLEPSHREGSAVEIPRNGMVGVAFWF
jgi:iron complex outermembrane receptor protein